AGRDEARAAGAAEAPTARAAAAVGFALAQLGKPYGWGSTGPDSFDCSGLTLASWGAAGVSLPRTSYAQATAGPRVSRSQLAPGDLVFYYPDNSHVALYIGNGQIVHAARSGTPVRLADVDSMPFNGATRPA
ncbi:C40 family peptidase, partial [Streptomyces triticirhizae]